MDKKGASNQRVLIFETPHSSFLLCFCYEMQMNHTEPLQSHKQDFFVPHCKFFVKEMNRCLKKEMKVAMYAKEQL